MQAQKMDMISINVLFQKKGHYLVVSDVDENDNFYVINPNKIGDNLLE